MVSWNLSLALFHSLDFLLALITFPQMVCRPLFLIYMGCGTGTARMMTRWFGSGPWMIMRRDVDGEGDDDGQAGYRRDR